jgi:serine/threonine-protein kinase
MPDQDPFSLLGQTLEQVYRIDSLVGEGGFGVVYKGFHLAFEQPIAVKCLKIPGSFSPPTREAFLRKFREEGRLLYQLSLGTLGIVRSIALSDTVTPAGIWAPFVVLEWLDGHPLALDIAQRARLGLTGRTLAETMGLLDLPARALAFAHERRVAHRDIKPGNLFVVPNPSRPGAPPTLKILDFGIAKVMEEGASAIYAGGPTQMGFSSFTPQYAAPEQFDPSVGPTGPWSDVYSFALVMVEMLTDRRPIDGDDPVTLLRGATNPSLRPTPRARGAVVADGVEGVFLRALAVSPVARFPELGAFWEALRIVSGEIMATTPPVVTSQPPTPALPGGPPMHASAAMAQLPTLAVTPPLYSGPLAPVVPVQAIPATPFAGPTPVVAGQAPREGRSWLFWLPLTVLILLVAVVVVSGVVCTTCVCVAI